MSEGLWLDGNGIAGILAEAFGTEMTTANRVCQSCGAESAIGAHRAYRGAAWVLRCPACGDVAARIAVFEDHHVVLLAGRWRIRSPRRA
jgi:predicted RNA-binding Zn-ribbon protein involved in translation (DUF1610 family)